ncbi:hypothetical protein ACOMHN_054392 [Nucella lapillus]
MRESNKSTLADATATKVKGKIPEKEEDSEEECVLDAGEIALVCLYNGRTGDTLDSLRYQRFHEKVSSCATSVQIQSLPPTTAAVKYHSLRVYLQVQEWINPEADLAPELWGWHKDVCGNPLTSVNKDVCGNPLTSVNKDVCGNPLTSVNKDIYGNSLSSVNKDIYGNSLSSVSKDVCGNPLTSVNKDVCGNPLTSVNKDIYGNPLTSVNKDVCGNSLTSVKLT